MNKFLTYTASLFCLYSSINASEDAIAGRQLFDGSVLTGKIDLVNKLRGACFSIKAEKDIKPFDEFRVKYWENILRVARIVADSLRLLQDDRESDGYRELANVIDALSTAKALDDQNYSWGPGDKDGALSSLDQKWARIPTLIGLGEALAEKNA
jgi:hypothetical protein